MRIAIYPGSFDPITCGHADIIARACALFDCVYVGVLINVNKQPLFDIKTRMQLITEVIKELGITNCRCESFLGLLADYANAKGACAVIRGLRDSAEFAGEYTAATLNHSINNNLETVFLPARPELASVSSSAVREILSFGGDVSKWVSPQVIAAYHSIKGE